MLVIMLVFFLIMQCATHHSLCNLQRLTFDILLMFFSSSHFFYHHCLNLFVVGTLLVVIAFTLWFSFHSFSSWWIKEWGGKRGSIITLLGMDLSYVGMLLGMGGAYAKAPLDMGGVLSRPSPLHSCNDRAHHHSHGKKLIYLFILGLAWAFVS